MNYHIELFQSLLNDFLDGESALLTSEGKTLTVRGEQPTSYGTLAMAATTATKYLKLQNGDIAILSDPYSGGSILSDITFIMAVSKNLIWVRRRSLKPSVKIAKSVEEEGLRIPPTPLLQKNQINKVILEAMQSHPLCHLDFSIWIKEQFTEMTQKSLRLDNALELSGFKITPNLLENYIELCKNTAQQRIGERSSGETRVDVVLDSGELLRVNMEIHEGRISLDFGGTTVTKTVSLTESATFGVCFHTICKFYGFEHIANYGSSSILELTKPSGCWLVGKYPAPTYKGMTCGVAALKTALELALAQIHQKGEQALSSNCSLQFDIHHANHNALLNLPGGRGANAQTAGAAAQTRPFSIEELERNFPIKVQKIDRRQSEGGKGKFEGGRGVIMKLEVCDNIEASWMTDLTLHRPRISKNCTHGDTGAVYIESQGESKILPVLGRQEFTRGDIITLCSGSGGGYGKS